MKALLLNLPWGIVIVTIIIIIIIIINFMT
jgi:hypothetical protein